MNEFKDWLERSARFVTAYVRAQNRYSALAQYPSSSSSIVLSSIFHQGSYDPCFPHHSISQYKNKIRLGVLKCAPPPWRTLKTENREISVIDRVSFIVQYASDKYA